MYTLQLAHVATVVACMQACISCLCDEFGIDVNQKDTYKRSALDNLLRRNPAVE